MGFRNRGAKQKIVINNFSIAGSRWRKMTAKKRSPLYQWEQEMLDAYYDDQWHWVLDPLSEKFRGWKEREVSDDELDQAIFCLKNRMKEKIPSSVNIPQMTLNTPTKYDLPNIGKGRILNHILYHQAGNQRGFSTQG